MLTREHRLTASDEFARVVRRGRRAGTRTLVVHAADALVSQGGPRVGFVVSKVVGPAVTRNLVQRRLRHLARERVPSLPGSVVIVVRALPASATADYATLAADLDRALERALR